MDKEAERRLLALRGTWRDIFEALGGGEALLRNEREEFSRDTEELDRRIEGAFRDPDRALRQLDRLRQLR